MIGMRITTILLGILCVGAATFGWASAPSANAGVQTITMNIHPGTEAGTTKLTCGWHAACPTGNETDGDALDWRNASGGTMHSVYLRTRTWYDGASTVGGYGEASQTTIGSCKTVAVEVRRPDNTSVLGTVYNKHAEDGYPWQFTISAGSSSSPILLASYVGETASTENQGCDWQLAHLHQQATGSFAENWSAHPDQPAEEESVQITASSEYQDYVSFQY